jgi:tryptophanyl-tRNA synthetase
LGNYLGAIRQWVKIQNGLPLELDQPITAAAAGTTPTAPASVLLLPPPPLFIFLADLHALTARPDPSQLRSSCLGVTATLLACGIDPARTTLFRQSAPELAGLHTQLSWILGVATPVSWLQRMTQYKDKVKSKTGGNEATWGLLSYPALQSADILLYQGTHVPVGKDQWQHVELCRDMAHAFNTHYAAANSASASTAPPFLFPLPLHLSTRSSKIQSLRNGAAKMSKSDLSDDSRINLTDTPDLIASKIKKAKTDSDMAISLSDSVAGEDDKKPETANLVRLYADLSGRSVAEVLADSSLCSTKMSFKSALTELLITTLSPIRAEFDRLTADPGYLATVLSEGEQTAAKEARETMKHVRRTVGLD